MKRLAVLFAFLLMLVVLTPGVFASAGQQQATCLLNVPALEAIPPFFGFFPIEGAATVSGNGKNVNASCKAQVPAEFLQPPFFPGPPDVDNNGHWQGANSCTILLGDQAFPATHYTSVLTPSGQFNVTCQYKG